MNAKLLLLFSLACVFESAVADSIPENVRPDAHKVLISRIPHQRVESTAIASVGYSKRRHILEIEFVNGAVYRYLQITPSVYRELMIANSKARYYDVNIKGNYCSIRMPPRTAAKP
jgi:hypothetical protein